MVRSRKDKHNNDRQIQRETLPFQASVDDDRGEEMRAAFKIFDKNRDGFITRSELKVSGDGGRWRGHQIFISPFFLTLSLNSSQVRHEENW